MNHPSQAKGKFLPLRSPIVGTMFDHLSCLHSDRKEEWQNALHCVGHQYLNIQNRDDCARDFKSSESVAQTKSLDRLKY